jgi:alkylhydroperoxidase/carboxymuconolactone decarboxylase family protein YurZ
MGNDKQKLVDTVSILIAFIGFPRMHNALAIINEVDM